MEEDSTALYCRVTGCTKSLSLMNHDILPHIKFHNITLEDYQRLVKPSQSLIDKLRAAPRRPTNPSVSSSDQTEERFGLEFGELALTRMIVGCSLPPEILANPAFIEGIRDLRHDRHYSLPSPRQFKRADGPLSRFAENLTSRAKERAKNAIAISVTFDIWSKFTFTGIGITLHLITSAFERDRISLGVIEFEQAHTCQAIVEMLSAEISNFCTFGDLIAMTHDSASNNTGKEFVKLTKFAIKIRCLMHKMSLAAKRLFKKDALAGKVLQMAIRLVKFFRKSRTARTLLQSHQTATRALPAFSETRFNGGYLVFRALLDNMEAIEAVVVTLRDKKYTSTYAFLYNKGKNINNTPMAEFWGCIESLLPVLEKVNDFIVRIQSREATLSDSLFELMRVKVLLRQLKTSDSEHMLACIDHYFTGVFEPCSAFVIASAMDPRGTNLACLLSQNDMILLYGQQTLQHRGRKVKKKVINPSKKLSLVLWKRRVAVTAAPRMRSRKKSVLIAVSRRQILELILSNFGVRIQSMPP